MATAHRFADGFLGYPLGTTDLSAVDSTWTSGTGTLDAVLGELTAPASLRADFTAGETCVAGVLWRCNRNRLNDDQVMALYAGSTRVMLLEVVNVPQDGIDTAPHIFRLTTEAGVISETSAASQILSGTDYWIVLSSRTVGAGSSHAVHVATVGGSLTARSQLVSASTTLTARNVDNWRCTSARATLGTVYVRGGTGAFGSSDRWEIPNKSYLPAASNGDYAVSSNWEDAAGGGNLAAPIGEGNPDADKTYLRDRTAPTAAAADRFSVKLASAPRAAATIYAAKVSAMQMLAVGAAATSRIMLSRGTSDSAGSTVSLGATYKGVGTRHLETEPVSAAALTISNLATLDVGLELVSMA